MIVTFWTGSHFWEDSLHDGVTALVVRDDQLLGVGDDAALALGPGHDPLEGLLEVDLDDGLAVASRGEDCALVDEVREVRAGPWPTRRKPW